MRHHGAGAREKKEGERDREREHGVGAGKKKVRESQRERQRKWERQAEREGQKRKRGGKKSLVEGMKHAVLGKKLPNLYFSLYPVPNWSSANANLEHGAVWLFFSGLAVGGR